MALSFRDNSSEQGNEDNAFRQVSSQERNVVSTSSMMNIYEQQSHILAEEERTKGCARFVCVRSG